MAVVLDSSVVVGFLDRSDDLHEAADREVRSLIRAQRFVVSVVTYAEVLTGAKLGHHDEHRVRGFFDELISEILPVEVPVADRAADLRAQTKSLAMPDALIVATAELVPGVEWLLSGDRWLGRLKGLDCRVRLLSRSS